MAQQNSNKLSWMLDAYNLLTDMSCMIAQFEQLAQHPQENVEQLKNLASAMYQASLRLTHLASHCEPGLLL